MRLLYMEPYSSVSNQPTSLKMAAKQVPQELLTRSFSVTVDRPDGVNENEERETKGLLLGFVDVKASRDPSLSAAHSHLLSDALSQVDSDCESDTRRPAVESTDAAAVRIGKELAEIADEMDQQAERGLDRLFSDFLPVLGSPSLAYQLFLNTAKRTFEWNESGVVRITASSLRHLLSLCYRLCQRFLEQFGHVSGAGKRLQMILTTLSGFIMKIFASLGFYQRIRDHGWQSIMAPVRNMELSSEVKIAFGVVVALGVAAAAGYFLYQRSQS